MPKVEIWCKQSMPVEGLKVWEGTLPAVPRVGEYIEVFDGWAGSRVESVTYMIYDEGAVHITIGPDVSGEYRRAVEERDG